MTITPTNTHWVLIGGMISEKAPDRFLLDIFFAYIALLNAKVPSENIDIIIDPIPTSSHPILNDFFTKKEILSIEQFSDVIQSNSLENLMIILNGHGNIDGLNSTNQLKPYELITEIHNRKNLKCSAVVFGQCFAGIYNYIDVLKRDTENKVCPDPIVCFIGASHLNSSISGSANIGENVRWAANIFLFHFFTWFITPKDIDGDGHFTLTDAFKYAGAQASTHLIDLKHKSAIGIQKAFKALDDIETMIAELEESGDNQLLVQQNRIEELAIKKSIEEQLSISHTNQDPWILNANKAREFKFSY
ncbi:MAG: hypothetical protein J7J96_06900 [Sulfurimonas sp.]|nr:hypothetical protein [Sulfurimonas sp.]